VPPEWNKFLGEYGWDYNVLYIMDQNTRNDLSNAVLLVVIPRYELSIVQELSLPGDRMRTHPSIR
jgi:hypothetical protein